VNNDPNNQPSSQDRVGDDLLVGAAAIGAEMNMSDSEVYCLCNKTRLPIGKWGKHLVASRSRLRRAARALTSGE
jgi:hypothetical protein